MKVLHLFSNHKITGPAELALETARALLNEGVEATFFSSDCKKTRYRDRWLQLLARERGMPEAVLPGVRLPKHIHPVRAFLDVRRLASALRADPPDVIHCHLPGDHIVAGWAVARCGGSIPIVRGLYDGEPPAPTHRTRKMLSRHTDALVCYSSKVLGVMRERAAEYGLDPSVLVHRHPPIDVHRFDPTRDGIAPRREALGVPEDAVCLGIVARMQTHRRFELLLEAFRQARAEAHNLHLVVVGRGTNQQTVAKDPVVAMGLEGAVHFPGYISGDEFVSTLRSFDGKIFLVPGSDGTCRAVREALAMGLPVIATKRGMLPELVRDGVDGLLVDETEASLRDAMLRLTHERDGRVAMSERARAGAVERFAYEGLARSLRELYEELIAKSKS